MHIHNYDVKTILQMYVCRCSNFRAQVLQADIILVDIIEIHVCLSSKRSLIHTSSIVDCSQQVFACVEYEVYECTPEI